MIHQRQETNNVTRVRIDGWKMEISFNKYHILGDDGLICSKIKTPIPMMVMRIPEKDIWCGARGKFIFR